jgi:hypothetical protein
LPFLNGKTFLGKSDIGLAYPQEGCRLIETEKAGLRGAVSGWIQAAQEESRFYEAGES